MKGASAYTGATNVNTGTLIVSGSISGSSTTTVLSGATLASGNNTTSSAGPVNVNDGGILDAGGSGGTALTTVGKFTTGALALGSSTGTKASLKMELGGTTAGTGYDQISTGATTLNLTNVNLAGSLINSFTPTNATFNTETNQFNLDGSTFYLIIGASGVNGTFANQDAADPNLSGFNTITFGGQEFAISYSASAGANTFTGGNDVALMAIPEPSTWAMLAAGLGVLVGTQRSRKRAARFQS
jgi:hypothetical protein